MRKGVYEDCAREPESRSLVEDQQGWPAELLTGERHPRCESDRTGPRRIESNGVEVRSLDPEQSFTMRFDVLNQGDAASTRNASVRYFRSADSTITRNDTELTVENRITAVGPLDPSRSHQARISLNAVSSGSYYYGACVGTVPGESNTQNNCATVLKVTVSEPDLVVVSPSVSNDEVDAEDEFEFQATVQNIGGRRTQEDTSLYYYRSSDRTITTRDVRVYGISSVRRLDPDEDSEESIRLTAPNSAGKYYYGACVVAVPGERKTTNNCSEGVTVTVNSNIQGAPDLVPALPVFSDDSPSGRSVRVQVTIHNVGNKQSDSTTLELRRSFYQHFPGSGSLPLQTDVRALDSGTDQSKTYLIRVPEYVGTYYHRVCVLEVEGESNTENNCSGPVEMVVE